MEVSPTPLTCQLAMGSPGLLFSHVMGLPPVPHGSTAPARTIAGTPSASTGAMTAMTQAKTTIRVNLGREKIPLMFRRARLSLR